MGQRMQRARIFGSDAQVSCAGPQGLRVGPPKALGPVRSACADLLPYFESAAEERQREGGKKANGRKGCGEFTTIFRQGSRSGRRRRQLINSPAGARRAALRAPWPSQSD
jgi:hypothetical protein